VAFVVCSIGGLPAVAADGTLPANFDAAAVEKLARKIVVEAVPPFVEDLKHWGKQKERPGFKFTGQGWGTRIKRNDKLVNHGLWKRYRIEPIDPGDRLELKIAKLLGHSEGRWTFTVRVSAPFVARATVEQWTMGVRTLSASAEAETSAVVELDCDVRTTVRTVGFLPEIVLEPKIVDARLDMEEFKLTKLGELPRGLAREFSDEAKKIALHYLRKQDEKALAKANAAILKKGKDGKIVLSPLQLLK
jgi:hypothetical protein